MSEASASVRLLANARVSLTVWTLPPGESTGFHRHEYDYVVLPLAGGELTATTPDGARTRQILLASVPYFRTAGVTHDITCSGPGTVEFIEFELLEESSAGVQAKTA